ncbi:tail fibers protein [Microcystis phage Mwe-JY25]
MPGTSTTRTVNAAANPRWGDASQTVVVLDVDFDELDEVYVPFAARADDAEEHGRDLHSRSLAGEFGPIAPYIAPPLPIPASITYGQFARALRLNGTITHAEAVAFGRTRAMPAALQAIIDGLPNQTAREDAELWLTTASVFERGHSLTSAIGAAFGWAPQQVDQFFRDAAAI